MPVEFLTATERDKLSQFPHEIRREDLVRYFSLQEEDIDIIATLQGDANQIGYALQLSALRYLGFIPSDLQTAPEEALCYLADQLDAAPETLETYGTRPKTIREHEVKVMEQLGFRRATDQDLERIRKWLTERALEHDRPSVLIELASGKLQRERLVRPGITVIERMVGTARSEAHDVSLQRLDPLLTEER